MDLVPDGHHSLDVKPARHVRINAPELVEDLPERQAHQSVEILEGSVHVERYGRDAREVGHCLVASSISMVTLIPFR